MLVKSVLNRLIDERLWGERYTPIDRIVGWLGRQVKDDGHRVREAIDGLYRGGLLLKHKSGATISLNPRRLREILEAAGAERPP